MNKYRVRGFKRIPYERKQFTVLANSYGEAKKFIDINFYPHIITRIFSVSRIIGGKEVKQVSADIISTKRVGDVRHVKIFGWGHYGVLTPRQLGKLAKEYKAHKDLVTYYCHKCKRFHRYQSVVGRRHLTSGYDRSIRGY